ncbi:MAG: hypothetical protein ACYDFU_08410 [Nitrospirota bacterium]
MKNKIDEFFKLARTVEPDISRAESGLETRVLARVRAEREEQAAWFTWTWRFVPVFTVLVIILGGWYYSFTPNTDMRTAITANYEQTMYLSNFMGDRR